MEKKQHVKRTEVRITVCDRSRYSNSLWSQFGLSMVLDVFFDDCSFRRTLFDTGWTYPPLQNNLAELGIPIESIDWLALSHSHYDHTGGLGGIMKEPEGRFSLIAHEEIARPVYSQRKSLTYIGMDPSLLGSLPQNRLLLVKEPVEFLPGVWFSGTIPRVTSFEQAEWGVSILEEGILRPDPENDDSSIFVDILSEGILVLTGCCHAGLINTLEAARNLFRERPIVAVIGGFHLVDQKEEVRLQTVDQLSDFPDLRVWSGHCTGEIGERMLGEKLGDRFAPFYTGDLISFGSC